MLNHSFMELFWNAALLLVVVATIASAHLLFRCDRAPGWMMILGAWIWGLANIASQVLWWIAVPLGWHHSPTGGNDSWFATISRTLHATTQLFQLTFILGLIWFALRLRRSREHLEQISSIERDRDSSQADAGPR